MNYLVQDIVWFVGIRNDVCISRRGLGLYVMRRIYVVICGNVIMFQWVRRSIFHCDVLWRMEFEIRDRKIIRVFNPLTDCMKILYKFPSLLNISFQPSIDHTRVFFCILVLSTIRVNIATYVILHFQVSQWTFGFFGDVTKINFDTILL